MRAPTEADLLAVVEDFTHYCIDAGYRVHLLTRLLPTLEAVVGHERARQLKEGR